MFAGASSETAMRKTIQAHNAGDDDGEEEKEEERRRKNKNKNKKNKKSSDCATLHVGSPFHARP